MKYPKAFAILSSLIAGISFILLMSAQTDQNKAVKVHQYFQNHLDSLFQSLTIMDHYALAADPKVLDEQFINARSHYKKIEGILAYYFPESELKLNGAAILESKGHMPNEMKYPTGFQILEALIYDDNINRQSVKNEISNLLFSIKKVKSQTQEIAMQPSQIMDAIKLNIYRLITKGIAGFDSPTILYSIPEAKVTLEGTFDLLHLLGSNNKDALISIQKSIVFIDHNYTDFDAFDRAVFIKDFLNPLCNSLHEYYDKAAIPFDTLYPKLVKANVPNLFSEHAFDVAFFAPSDQISINGQSIQLGRTLFNDSRLSVNNIRSCASCHDPSKAFTDGKQLNESIAGNKTLLRNTPSLYNAALQPNQFFDRRTVFLEDQIHDVVSNPDEMGGIFKQIIHNIKNDAYYNTAFKKVFEDKKITERNIKRAIAAYIRSLSSLNSAFDQYMRGNEKAMSTQQLKGFNLFMGKAKCGTCHFVPLFNGVLPPQFYKLESEVIGIPQDAQMTKLDPDVGYFAVYGATFQKHSFKTSTIRNVSLTAPYMHNGVFKTLDEVLHFYNIGGGVNLGFDLPYQTLPTDSLHLSTEESKAIISFMEALVDTLKR